MNELRASDVRLCSIDTLSTGYAQRLRALSACRNFMLVNATELRLLSRARLGDNPSEHEIGGR